MAKLRRPSIGEHSPSDKPRAGAGRANLTPTSHADDRYVAIGNHGRFPAAWECRPNQWLTLVGEDLARSDTNSRAVLMEVSTYIEDFPVKEYALFHQALGQFAFTMRDVVHERMLALPREVAVVHRHDSGWFARILCELPKGVRTRRILSALAESWPCQFRYRFLPALSWKTEARNQLFWINLARWDYLVLSRDYEKPDGVLNRMLGAGHD